MLLLQLKTGYYIVVHITNETGPKIIYHAYNLNSPCLKNKSYTEKHIAEKEVTKEMALEALNAFSKKKNSGFYKGAKSDRKKTDTQQTQQRLRTIQSFLETKVKEQMVSEVIATLKKDAPVKDLILKANELNDSLLWDKVVENLGSRKTVPYDDMLYVAEKANHQKLHTIMLIKLRIRYSDKRVSLDELEKRREKDWVK